MGSISEHAKKAAGLAKDAISEVLWPTRCAICDKMGSVICHDCLRALPFIDTLRACPSCGAPYGIVQCSECAPDVLRASGFEELPFDSMVHVLLGTREVTRMVSIFKDSDEVRLGRVFALLLYRYIPISWRRLRPTIAYLPCTKEAFRRRGFDHMREVAANLSEMLGCEMTCPFERPLSSDQRKHGRNARFANVDGRVIISKGARIPESAILIDDICTTGATMYSMAKALRDAGCERVYGATLGKVLA